MKPGFIRRYVIAVLSSALLFAAGFAHADATGPVTGLLIDAAGLSVRRAMTPLIYDEQGKVVYPTADVPVAAAGDGWVSYLTNPNQVPLSRAGKAPLIVKALRRTGATDGDVVISDADAKTIREAGAKFGFLKRAMVAFLIGTAPMPAPGSATNAPQGPAGDQGPLGDQGAAAVVSAGSGTTQSPAAAVWTGILIDVTAFQIERVPTPKVVDEQGKAVFPAPGTKPAPPGRDFYLSSRDQLSTSPAGANPLVVKALRPSNSTRGAVVITAAAAKAIAEADAKYQLLKSGKVAFLIASK